VRRFLSNYFDLLFSDYHETWQTVSTCQYAQNGGTDFRHLAGTVLVQVKALDSDGGLNGEVRYSLSDDISAELIYINERTGVLRLGSSLDRETTSQLEFTVWATDSGEDPKSASAEVSAQRFYMTILRGLQGPHCSAVTVSIFKNSVRFRFLNKTAMRFGFGSV